jgi:hypothetical protein
VRDPELGEAREELFVVLSSKETECCFACSFVPFSRDQQEEQGSQVAMVEFGYGAMGCCRVDGGLSGHRGFREF